MDTLIEHFAKLPGIGKRSAERLAFYILKSEKAAALDLAAALRDVKEKVRHCSVCWNLADTDRCGVCEDASRDRSLVLVVEQPKDLIALEQTGMYKGLYHVLMGRLSPLDGVGVDAIGALQLLERAADGKTEEVIIATNFTAEGEATAHVLAEALKSRGLRVTRLARGVPIGSELEYVDLGTIAHALQDRR